VPIDLSKISASIVGAYAACPLRLVFDSKYGKPFESSPEADFGTVCHYFTQYMLGVAPDKEPSEETIANAKRVGFVNKPAEAFDNAVMACAKKAIEKLPKLKDGVTWVTEMKVHDKTLLPERVTRKGEKLGFGGDVDLLASDRSELWDLKFVGRAPDSVKVEYLWQKGSYHLASGVPITGILFVTRDAKWSGLVKIDWTKPPWPEMVGYMRGAIEWMGHANFERHAYPVEGDHCGFCSHKNRCPVKQVPMIQGGLSLERPVGDINWLEKLKSNAKGPVL
jgi:hypothetical protein